MNLSIKIEGLEGLDMSGDVLKAARYAVNDTVRHAKAKSSRLIAARWNVKKQQIGGAHAMEFVGKSKENPTGYVSIDGNSIDLASFGAVQHFGNKVMRKDKKSGLLKESRIKKMFVGPQPSGVMVEIIKGRRTLLRNSFLRNVRDFAGRHVGGATAYSNKFSARLLSRFKGKINVAASISIASAFEQPAIEDKVVIDTQKYLNDRFGYHFDRISKVKA